MSKLPSAWLCGVRLKHISDENCVVSVRHRWINQNPFKSMYFAVQNMAAELSTGALVMKSIKECGKNISMLVVEANSQYFKKATGKINFYCEDGRLVNDTIRACVQEKTGKTMVLKVRAENEDKVTVSEFQFTWSVKLKS